MGGLEPGDEVKYDSLNVLRIPRGDTIADTVARLKLPPWGDGQFGEQKKIVSTIFGGRDLFGVLPDGSIWVARASNNAVDWRDPSGKWQKGPSRSYTRISVTEDDKKSFLEKVRSQMSQVGAPAGIELSYPFADYKPPFSAGDHWRRWLSMVAAFPRTRRFDFGVGRGGAGRKSGKDGAVTAGNRTRRFWS